MVGFPPPSNTRLAKAHSHDLRIIAMQIPLIPLLRPLRRSRKLHMRAWIPQLLKLALPQPLVRGENRLALHILQLRNPFSDVVAVFVAFLGLGDRVENRVRGLPAVGVVAEVPVDEVGGEVALAAAVVEEEVGAEVGGGGHAEAVVHVFEIG